MSLVLFPLSNVTLYNLIQNNTAQEQVQYLGLHCLPNMMPYIYLNCLFQGAMELDPKIPQYSNAISHPVINLYLSFAFDFQIYSYVSRQGLHCTSGSVRAGHSLRGHQMPLCTSLQVFPANSKREHSSLPMLTRVQKSVFLQIANRVEKAITAVGTINAVDEDM